MFHLTSINVTVLICTHTGAWGYSNSIPLEPGAHREPHRGVIPAFVHNDTAEPSSSLKSKETLSRCSVSDYGSAAVWIAGQSGDTKEDQSLAVWSRQRRGDRKPLRPPAEGDSRQELCQLLWLLREVGAAGASASALQRERAEQEIPWEFWPFLFIIFIVYTYVFISH